MQTVDVAIPFESPEPESVVGEVFGISETELDVCRRLMAAGEATVNELASDLDYDRSVITRHLNHLVDLGVVEKEPRDLSGGGRKYVYTPISVERMRRRLILGLHAWLADAMAGVDELNREKIEAMAERAQEEEERTTDSELPSVLGKVFGRNRST